jgi:hypothetical protein
LVNDSKVDPASYDDAMASDRAEDWRKAMDQEMNSLVENGTWTECLRPRGRNVVENKWVYRTKYNPDGTIEKLKARLVAKGYTQRFGHDYVETFAPVSRKTTFRVMVALAAGKGYRLRQLDVSSAYLQANVTEELYMELPQGYGGDKSRVLRLHKSIYGLKQAGFNWNVKLNGWLGDHGFKVASSDRCLYVGEDCWVAIYVDDILWCGATEQLEKKFVMEFCKEFKAVDQGSLAWYLGMKVTRHGDGSITVDQSKYASDLLKKTGMDDSRPMKTPMDKPPRAGDDLSISAQQESAYRTIVGGLMYLATGTRPDLAFAVGRLCKHLKEPRLMDNVAMKRVLRYLAGTVDLGLVYSRSGGVQVTGFADASWGDDPNTRRSTTGYVFMLSGCGVDWRSRVQPAVALSTAEAEYMAISDASQEAIFMKKMMGDFGEDTEGPLMIYNDNKGALAIVKNEGHHMMTRHIDMKVHYVREVVKAGVVDVTYQPGTDMPADIFTKALDRVAFVRCREIIMGHAGM